MYGRDATIHVDTDHVRPADALRHARDALRGLIKRYHRVLEKRVLSDDRSLASVALMAAQIDGARYLLLRAPVPPRRSLTDRQLEVALLAAQGLSNKALAERLSITAATVAAHLRVIYKKLEVGSRAGLLLALLDRDEWSRPSNGRALPSEGRADAPSPLASSAGSAAS